MDGARREVAAIFLGADIGRELDGITAPCELLRQRRGGKEMAPRTASGEQDRLRAHAARSLTGGDSASGSAGGLRFSCPAFGRLRVKPSAKPMVSAMASSDEPP